MQKSGAYFFFMLILLYSVSSKSVLAQTYPAKLNLHEELKMAVELYKSNNYISAQKILDQMQSVKLGEDIQREVDFYSALIALKSDANETVSVAERFKINHRVYSKMYVLDLLLADYYFDRHQYKKAIPIYENIPINLLNQTEKDRYNFRLGYCYFTENQFEKANDYLYKAKESKSVNALAATYYYGHIAYQGKKYTTAYKAFKEIENNATFADIVPYYFVQIAFNQQQYQQAISEASVLYNKASDKRKPEIAQILGVSLFQTEEYAKSIEYLEFYRQAVGSDFTDADYYQLAFAYMKSNEYQQAIKYFEKVKIQNNALSQNALYNVGACYLKMGKKQFAGEAFYRAYELNFDRKLKEDALFNFAKVSYELSNDPYNKAIKALLEFMTNFPNSDRISEANEYLVNLFMSAKNYKGALDELERIPNKNQQLLAAYQKITFNRAIELFRDRNYMEAMDLLKKSLAYNFDKLTHAKAQFWLAETYYQVQNYKMASSTLEELRSNTMSRQINEYRLIDYSLAYAYFQSSDYQKSKTLFLQFIQKSSGSDAHLVDAYLRIADIHFIQKEFSQAIGNYENAERLSPNYLPYAMYQKAQAHGGSGNFSEKIRILKSFVNSGRDYDLSDDAYAELGATYMVLGNENEAIQAYKSLMINFPNSPFYKNALLKTGLTYYNLDNTNEALAHLKKLVSNYPSAKESKEALVIIKNIYVESNAANEFLAYIKDLPQAHITSSGQDTIVFRAAENVYMKGNCQSAINGFSDYLQQFPNGAFSVNARFYRAECLLKSSLLNQAEADLLFVVNHRKSIFYESSLVKLAEIYLNQKKYGSSLQLFTRLSKIASSDKNRINANNGQMESYHQLNMHDSTIYMAKQLLRSPLADDQVYKRAHLYLARSAFKTNQLALAQSEYSIVENLLGGNSSAEAKYHLATIQYQKGDYKSAEKIVFELIKDYASYDYWIASGFILLADIYLQYGNTFQAKHTLQSIIDNQTDVELVNIAKKKKEIILEMEYLEQKGNKKVRAQTDTIRVGVNY